MARALHIPTREIKPSYPDIFLRLNKARAGFLFYLTHSPRLCRLVFANMLIFAFAFKFFRGEVMADKIIPESDLNDGKTKRAAETLGGDDAPPLFDSAGVVEPSAPTEGATMPETPSPVKRGRGRPRKEGRDQTVKLKAKPKKKTPEQAEAEGMTSAQIIVAGLDVMRKAISAGEAPGAPKLRNATIEAWQTYLAEKWPCMRARRAR